MWSSDRLHLSSEGHRRVALRSCEILGVPQPEDWRVPLPLAPLAPLAQAPGPAAVWASARRQDLRWAKQFAMPWLNRRLRGTSSGAGLPPKRPDLAPIETLALKPL
jgi:hypothetical protein